MKSYKNWKLLKESALGGTFTLGVQSPNVIGTVGTSFGFSEIDAILDEAKKKCSTAKCKKMDGDLGEPEVEPEEPEKKKPVDVEPEEKPETPDEPEVDDKGGDEEEPELGKEEKPTLFQKKQKKMKKEEADPDADWWRSVHDQLSGGLPGQKFYDGIEPGQPGFAPTTRVGEVGTKTENTVTAEEALQAILNDPRVPEEVKKEYGLQS